MEEVSNNHDFDNLNANLLYKIYTGKSDEMEKNENNFEDLSQKLREYCEMGYNLASKMDPDNKNEDFIYEVRESLKQINCHLEELNKKVDFLMNR